MQAIELIQPAPVMRDESGSFCHPGMPEFEEGQETEWKEWLAAQGLEISCGKLEDRPDDHPVYIDYFENGACSFAGWTDEPPAGEGWFTLSIHDTEDGPIWAWARRTASLAATKPENT